MSSLRLVIGNKNYSSWSMRPWLVLRHFEIPFEEGLIPLFEGGWKAQVLGFSPAGKVPILIDDDVTVWETMAIIETLADMFPDKDIWPRDWAARAHARAVSNEMHAGFGALRSACPMNIRRKDPGHGQTPEVLADVARITDIWREARACFGSGGAFLYGDFSAADAMYAPVVSRFESYGFEVDETCRAYMDAILTLPAFVEWSEAGSAESWRIGEFEV